MAKVYVYGENVTCVAEMRVVWQKCYLFGKSVTHSGQKDFACGKSVVHAAKVGIGCGKGEQGMWQIKK